MSHETHRYQIHGDTWKKTWQTWLVKLLLLSVLPMVVLFGGDFIQAVNESIYRMGFRFDFNRKGMISSLFNTGDNIGRAFSRWQREFGDVIILRVISDEAPGYLRGTVAVSYSGGRWVNMDVETYRLTGRDLNEDSRFKTYSLLSERQKRLMNYPVEQSRIIEISLASG